MIEEVTLKSLAVKIQTSVERLIKQFADAGILKSENDKITQKEREVLLLHLNKSYGYNPLISNKLILQRKTRSTLNITNSGGKNKSINIEIRKKHTYVKNLDFFEKTNVLSNNIIETVNIPCITKEINKIDNVVKKEKLNIKKTNKTNKKNKVEKTFLESEVADFKRKSEETSRIKLEKESKRIAEEARRMARDKKHENWNIISEEIEDHFDYHITTSKHARNAEDANDLKIENDRRNRSNKNKKYFDSQISREVVKPILKKHKNKRKINNFLQQVFYKPTQVVSKNIIIGETITIAELANKMAIKSSQIIKSMMKMGFIVTINQVIDQETAQLVAEEIGHKVIVRKDNQLEESIMLDRDITNKLEIRSPVVTIMGHVDHGKTSLLDYIRSTKTAVHEVGGITQHIGAYHIKIKNNIGITFLDTPGHAAFTAMRSRGINITDIVVLVVAADDGVMPQTIEAIKHAKSTDVPIIVAINKIDKDTSNVKHIKNELMRYKIIPEEWGGDNIFVEISAKLGTGIDNLIKSILVQSEILELKAMKLGMASGVVIESYLDKNRGPVANVLVNEGTLKRGDIVLCGLEYGKIRTMINELGQEIIEAGPSKPVKIFGLSGIPISSDKFNVVREEKKAREVALYRQNKYREIKLFNQQKNKLENMTFDMVQHNKSDINLLIKTDVQGSLEAISNVLLQLSTDKITIKIVYSGVGDITETDAILASATNAKIIGFNVRVDTASKKIIDTLNVDIHCYSIIYNLIDEIKKIIDKTKENKNIKNIIGTAEVRSVFKSPKFGTIAGCMVLEGIIRKNKIAKIIRNDIVIYEGEIESLRRFKEDVTEVKKGIECGISIKNFHDIKNEDIIELFETLKK